MRAISILAMFLVGCELCSPSLLAQKPVSGVVVHDVEDGSLFGMAGIEVGDVILAWRRLEAPPANPEEASGEIESAFDYMWLALEQAPRGEVELTVERDGDVRRITVASGEWKPALVPRMPDPRLEDYLRGKVTLDPAAAERLWMEVAEGAADWRLRCWMYMAVGAMHEDWGKAFAAYRAALDEAEDPFPESVIWRAIGKRHEQRGELDQARDAYDAARELRESSGRESLALAESWIDLANLAQDRRDAAQAGELYRQALDVYRKLTPQSPAIADLQHNVGAMMSRLGDPDQAETLLHEALAVTEKTAPSSTDSARTLTNLGIVASDRGDLERAAEFHRRALAINESRDPESRDVALTLNNLATVELQRGDFDAAERHLRHAQRIWHHKEPGSLDASATFNNLGALANARGDFEQAWDHYHRALEIRQELAPGSLDLAGTLNSLGVLAFKRGDLERARDLLEQALEIRRRAAGKLIQAATLSNLGSVALLSGEQAEAEDYFQQALEIYQQMAPASLDVASVLSNLGTLALLRGEEDQAVTHHRHALEILEEPAPVTSGTAESVNVLAVVAHQRGDFKRAESLYLRALDTWRQVAPDSGYVAAVLFQLGYLNIQMRPPRLAEADRFLSQALDALESQLTHFGGSHETRAGFRAEFDYYYRVSLDVQLALDRSETAFYTLERSRARSFLEHARERDIVFTADIPEALDARRRNLAARFDQAQRGLATLNEHEHAPRIEALREALRRLRDEAREVEEKIRAASPRLAALQYPQPLEIEAARSALDPGTLLLSYSVGKEGSYLFAVSQDRALEVERLPVRGEALAARVKDLLTRLDEARSGSSIGKKRLEQFKAASRELYVALIEPVAERVAASQRLLILPDGPLHALPFAALLRGGAESAEGEQYLVGWKPIHVALSATVYRELTERRRTSAKDESVHAPVLAAFGDPAYPRRLAAEQERGADQPMLTDAELRSVVGRDAFDWRALPYTRREVEGIAALYPPGKVRTFVGADAVEERVKSLDRDTRILHLAAHAYTDDQLPSSSFVALSIPDAVFGEAAEVAGDNGLLQVWEILERVRLDADLVVLSACESGLGRQLGSEGLIGLTRAFQYAGARSVVASLWSVADQTTAELMIRFHRHLRYGLPKDEALRAAQLELIRGPIELTARDGQKVLRDASAPYHWAAFQVYGDWQ